MAEVIWELKQEIVKEIRQEFIKELREEITMEIQVDIISWKSKFKSIRINIMPH